MATFGNTTDGNTYGTGPACDLFGCSFTSPSDCGHITKISVLCKSLSGNVKAIALLYADNNGKPGALLTSSPEVSIDSLPNWNDFAISYSGNPNTVYWLCVEPDGSSNFTIYYNGIGGSLAVSYGQAYPYKPDPWNQVPTDIWNLCIYATYDWDAHTMIKWVHPAATPHTV